MKLVFLGAPGVGKGTQAKKLADHLAVPHISTGDIFRQNMRDGTDLGKEAKEYVDGGLLVPDELVVRMVAGRLGAADCASGYILDGFPRTKPQALALKDTDEQLDAVVYFTASEDALVQRLSGRRMCRKCGAGFNVVTMPPKADGVCDQCGGELYQRDDDAPDTVRRRLEVYNNETAELVDFYRLEGLLHEIPGEGGVDEVYESLLSDLQV